MCMMGLLCHARLFFQTSWLLQRSVAPSSAAELLLILLPARRAGPSPIPPSQVDPISLRVQAPSRFFVGYTNFRFIETFWKNGFPQIVFILKNSLNTTIGSLKRVSDKDQLGSKVVLMGGLFCQEIVSRVVFIFSVVCHCLLCIK
jgi:hypothetical protein